MVKRELIVSVTLALVCFAFVALAAKKTKWHELEDYTFEKYVDEYKKVYESPQEYKFRRAIFEERLINIRKHNKDTTKTWKKGVNHLSDRTDEEMKRLRGLKKGLTSPLVVPSPITSIPQSAIQAAPKFRDWRDAHIITAVKDQGMCGSCWTFATAETLESYWANKTGQLTVLSEQQILDCTPNPEHCGGTGGCGGGTAELAYARIMEMGGLATEWTYPYVSYQGKNFECHFGANTPAFAKVQNFVKLPSNVYEPLFNHIANVGPLAISVDASAWGEYETGVFDGCNQTNPDIDHAVQLVGYGTTDDGLDYWLVRNSWSPAWGENGYIRLLRTPNKLRCGVDLTPSDGTGCDNGPANVTVCGTCGILYDNCYPVV